MSVDIQKYSPQLRRLVEEYYHRQITMEDYRLQRKRMLDQLEMELAGNADTGEAQETLLPESSTTPP